MKTSDQIPGWIIERLEALKDYFYGSKADDKAAEPSKRKEQVGNVTILSLPR